MSKHNWKLLPLKQRPLPRAHMSSPKQWLPFGPKLYKTLSHAFMGPTYLFSLEKSTWPHIFLPNLIYFRVYYFITNTQFHKTKKSILWKTEKKNWIFIYKEIWSHHCSLRKLDFHVIIPTLHVIYKLYKTSYM